MGYASLLVSCFVAWSFDDVGKKIIKFKKKERLNKVRFRRKIKAKHNTHTALVTPVNKIKAYIFLLHQ